MKQEVHVTESLVERCRKGDQKAFRQLYDQYAKAATPFSRTITKRKE